MLADPVEQPGLIYDLMCTHAQQAAEKASKGVPIHFGVEPPYTHDLGRLARMLAELVEVPDEITVAEQLTPHAVLSRYPDGLGGVDEAERAEAVAMARTVVA